MSGSDRTARLRAAGAAAGWALLFSAVVGLGLQAKVRSDLLDEAEGELLLLQALRASTLERYFESVRSEVALWSSHGPPREALIAYAAAWEALGPDASATLRGLYVEENPDPARGESLIDPGDGSAYSALHASAHPRAGRLIATLGYHDIFLVDPVGNVVYTYRKEDDFATNLIEGPWADTGLGRAVRGALGAEDPATVTIADFELYGPSEGAPAAFVAGPIYDRESRALGVLALQIPDEPIDTILRFTEGMGETGETYAIGGDLLMRNDSRFSETRTLLDTRVETEPARRALAGEHGVLQTTDYRGVESLSAYGPLEIEDLRWAVLAEKDVAEILQPLRRLRRLLFLAGAVSVLLVGIGAAAFDGRGPEASMLRSPLSDR